MPSKLCIRFLHLKNPKGEKVSNVLIYIKKLSAISSASDQSIKLHETESDRPEVLNFDNDFIFSSEHEYIQVMFIKTENAPEFLIDQAFRFDTLYSILYQSNPAQKQFPETIHTAILEKNYSLTFQLRLCNYTNQENKQKRNAERLYRTRGHALLPASFSGLTYCSVCRKFIWGVTDQGCKCAQCNLAVHFKCCERIPFWCAFAFVESPCLLAGNGVRRNETPHCFEPMRRGLNQFFDHCDHCGSKLWDIILKCSSCNFVIHEKCLGFVPSLCGTKYSILDKQIRNGVFKEVFSRTSTSDGENRNSSTSASSTMSSASSTTGDYQTDVLPKYSDFECIGRLGQGAFSTVYIAKHIPTNELVTLKVINGTDAEAREQIKREKDFLFKFSHDNPYIIKAFCTFHHGDYLFLVMEFVGGDTLYQRIMKKPLNDNEVRHYLVEIISVLQYIHSKHIIYRDLKLEHIVVNSEGHIRLIDYGLARTLDNNEEMCETICGTPGYVAPEINQLETTLQNDGYRFSVDFWSLGIVFAQLLRNERLTETYNYTENLSGLLLKHCKATAEARSLLSALLEIDKHKRLGSPLSPHGDIREHRFFQGDNKLNWSEVDEGIHKSANKQIILQESYTGSFNNTPLSRLTFDRDCKTEWNAIGQSKCTTTNERLFHSFDSINVNVRSVFFTRHN